MNSKKVYVVCPAGIQTGGTELLHQFVYELLQIKVEAYIVYEDKGRFIKTEIPSSFKEYDIQVTSHIEDEQDSVVVLPEIFLFHSRKFSKAHFLFWWLSVDNYYHKNSSLCDYIKFYTTGNTTAKFILRRIRDIGRDRRTVFNFKDIKKIDKRVLHAYQSSYASHELLKRGFFKQIKLTDYINTRYMNTVNEYVSERKNIVLYNPAKGLEVTKRIIKKLPDIEFVPLKKLSREQMIHRFREAKLYIDFGTHPGKDRIPREACANGCCIIVGKRGSAKYFEDVPIHDDYKFDEKDIDKITVKIREILNNYNKHNINFHFYRTNIADEYKRFIEEVKAFSEIITHI